MTNGFDFRGFGDFVKAVSVPFVFDASASADACLEQGVEEGRLAKTTAT